VNIEEIEQGDVLYINHHVAEPQLVNSDVYTESLTDFSDRSAEVTVDEIHEDEGIVIVTEKQSDESARWVLEPGHLLRRWDPDSNDR
jgi:hypothetical protein